MLHALSLLSGCWSKNSSIKLLLKPQCVVLTFLNMSKEQFGKHAFSLSCHDLDKRIDTTLTSVGEAGS